jgi:hypothetical protein
MALVVRQKSTFNLCLISAVKERLTAVPCVVCGQPVRLYECKTNDLGEPVHEACLVEPKSALGEILDQVSRELGKGKV